MKGRTTTIDNDFEIKFGEWWDSLSNYQRSMLILSHKLSQFHVTSSTAWKHLDPVAQHEVALRLCLTFCITHENKFPLPPTWFQKVSMGTKPAESPTFH